jgi:hypothetical protein
MRSSISRSDRASYKISQIFFASKRSLVFLALLGSVLLISTYRIAGHSADKPGKVKPVPAFTPEIAPIPEIVITAQRMTQEQKRDFDTAQAKSEKAEALKFAVLQTGQK